jgi:hypothetical protein
VALEKIMNSWFTVSAELKDLVIHNFKSEDERRYSNQVILTWISIIVAICIGLLSYCK